MYRFLVWSLLLLWLFNNHGIDATTLPPSGVFPAILFKEMSLYLVDHVVLPCRGGQDGKGSRQNDNGNENDEDDENDLDGSLEEYDIEDNNDSDDYVGDEPTADFHDTYSRRSSSSSSLPPSSSSSQNQKSFKGDHDSLTHGKRRRPPPSIPRKAPKHWTQRVASQSLKMGSQFAWGAVQQTGNVAYQLVKPRHVEPGELQGLWRLDQQISSSGTDIASVATVELDPRRKVVMLKLPTGKTIQEPYTFRKTRLGSYQTEFVAPAFLVGDVPRLYGYRGTWQRKLADKRVIKLVGKIYQVKKQRFGKGKGTYVLTQPVGTFVARRRMKLLEEDDDEEEDEFSDDGADSEYEGPEDHENDTDNGAFDKEDDYDGSDEE